MLNTKIVLAGIGLAGLVMGTAAGCGAQTNAEATTAVGGSPSQSVSAPKSGTPASPHTKTPRPVTFHTLAQPTPKNPLKVLVIGDSLGEDLQDGLLDVAGKSSSLDIIPASYGSSGLINTKFYNWPRELAADLTKYHPQLVYMMFGANDSYSFYQNGRYVAFGSAYWRQVYGGRANSLIVQAQRAGARVIWVGEPIMSTSSVLSNAKMQTLNALYASEVNKHRAIAQFVPTWKLFQNAQGSFTQYMNDSAGTSVMVRDPDGVHIAPPAGDELIASYLLYHTQQLEKVSLCVNGSDLWTQYPLKGCSVK